MIVRPPAAPSVVSSASGGASSSRAAFTLASIGSRSTTAICQSLRAADTPCPTWTYGKSLEDGVGAPTVLLARDLLGFDFADFDFDFDFGFDFDFDFDFAADFFFAVPTARHYQSA